MDKARKENELPELFQILERNSLTVQKVHKNLREMNKWQRYMRCDGTPDPTIPQEINTFINLSKENPNVDIKSLFEGGRTILQLLDELEMLLSDTPPDELPEATADQYQQTIWDLQELLSNINDKATDILLQKAVDLVDIETGNMQEVVTDENITLCLWANFNKNPRFKGYAFVNHNVEFELPKPLAMSDIAVRILHTHYDHISCRSPTFYAHQRVFKMKPVAVEIKEDIDEDLEVPAGVEQQKIMEDQKAPEEQKAFEEQKALEEQHVLEAKQSTDEEAKPVRLTRTKSAISTSSKEEAEMRSGASSREGIGEDIERKVLSVEPIKDIPSNERIEMNVVDYNQYTPLGGIYYFDVLKLPPQPKFVKGWRIVQLTDIGLQTCPYPPESTKEDSPTPDEKEGENPPAPPAGITIKLPPKALFFEQPKPARWDPEGKQWRTDGIHSITFDPEEQMLSFKMDTFNIFTLIQRYHVNMPFQFWEIKPVAENEAILTVVAAFTKVEIRIKIRSFLWIHQTTRCLAGERSSEPPQPFGPYPQEDTREDPSALDPEGGIELEVEPTGSSEPAPVLNMGEGLEVGGDDLEEDGVSVVSTGDGLESLSDPSSEDARRVLWENLLQVGLEVAGKLESPISLGELTGALDSLSRGKSLDLDELTVEFFRAFWDILGNDYAGVLGEILKQDDNRKRLTILQDLCQLCPVPMQDNLSNLRGKWMTASTLIISMINAGLNIFPGAESEKYVKINAKNKQVALDTYTQMALVSSVIAFRHSKWNFYSDPEEILLQACENLSGEMIAEEDWSLYMLRPERSHKLKMKESNEELSKEIVENTDFYSNLYHMMRGLASDAAKERILNTDHLFFSSMHEILEATQLLTHTLPVN
ncbi:dynein intermediate chain CFAP94, axonemal [Carcharodon carcharias]|uniref:dynein intermediate chain CFAP94, axonemal n=1 Tax=Carcharodon carcharias TaxID=13397 RepID=UPI001B7E6BEF|nr:dynein intermediate chain CFAP94, axonemal [Carcharodon carcharias]